MALYARDPANADNGGRVMPVSQQTIDFTDGKYGPPTKCVSSNCRSRSFELQRGSPKTVTVDWQKIRYVQPGQGANEQQRPGSGPQTAKA